MNPWQSLRSEISGALRSFKYDLARKRMNTETMELPVIRPGRRRMVLATGAALLPAAAFSGYLAVSSGMDALLAENGAPAGLPPYAAPAPSTHPEPPPHATPEVAVTKPTNVVIRPPWPSKSPESTMTGSPPVPTPAPTKSCSPSPSPSPSPSASEEPTPTPAPTWSATP